MLHLDDIYVMVMDPHVPNTIGDQANPKSLGTREVRSQQNVESQLSTCVGRMRRRFQNGGGFAACLRTLKICVTRLAMVYISNTVRL